MAGESWKSHKNTSLQRDMDADHDAQLSEWNAPELEYLPAEIEQHEKDQLQREYDAGMYRDGEIVPSRIVSTQEIVQEIRDGYARDVDPAVQAARAQAIDGLNVDPFWDRSPEYGREWDALMARYDAEDAQEQAQTADQIAADWARNTGQSIDQTGPVQGDSVERLQVRADALRRRVPGEPGYGSAQVYVPPPPDPRYLAGADYPSVVVANTRVVPAETPQTNADTARFQTQLAIAQQVAAQQMRAQRQTDTETAERQASAALGQYIAPTSAAPARIPHR
jgi:hypothetical protein